MNKTLLNIFKFLIFLGIGVSILYLVYQSQNASYMEECAQKGIAPEDCSLVEKVINDFKAANYFWIFMVLVAFTISNISRAIRWNMLMRSLGYTPRLINAFFTTILGYFANLGFPRFGEIVRPATMARYENIPVEKVLGTVVVDRVMDILSILLISGLVLVLEFRTIIGALQGVANLDEKAQSLGGNPLLWAILTAAVGLLALTWLLRKQLMQTRLFQKLQQLFIGFLDGLKTVARLRRPWLFVFHSINVWFMYYLMTYLCFFSFEPTAHLSPLAGLLVFVFSGWGIVIPSPGGMGTYHYLTIVALSIYGVDGNDAFSFANICFFSVQIGSNVILGILALILLPLLNKGYNPVVEITFEKDLVRP